MIVDYTMYVKEIDRQQKTDLIYFLEHFGVPL